MALGEISDYKLRLILKKLNIPIEGIYCKNEFPSNPEKGFYIINLEKSTDGNGTHWTALYVAGDNQNYYFDSFGFAPPKEIEDKLKVYYYNKKDLQNIEASSCGYYCF